MSEESVRNFMREQESRMESLESQLAEAKKERDEYLRLLGHERDEFGKKELALMAKARALAGACDYFLEHSVPPFTTDKWRLENRIVIGKAMAAFKEPKA